MNNINVLKEIRKIRAKFYVEKLISQQKYEQDVATNVKEFCIGKSQSFEYCYKLLDDLIEKLEKQTLNI